VEIHYTKCHISKSSRIWLLFICPFPTPVNKCGVLCHALAQKTGSQALGAVCDILCDVVGIKEFIKLVQK
jgi:hypothetical protein